MMITKIRQLKRSGSGFTLLELLVVVGILAALVALALPYYQDYVSQSKLTAAQTDLQTYKKALAMYDQLEPKMFGANSETTLEPLIGKYLQDYRKNSTQDNPVDPWGNDYYIDVDAGTIGSNGPDGARDVAVDSRDVADDDLLVTWKPDFFVATARRVNSNTLEIVFSRKVEAFTHANVTTPADGASSSKISDTIFRVTFTAALSDPPQTLVVANTVKAQDGRTLSEATTTKPDGDPCNQAKY